MATLTVAPWRLFTVDVRTVRRLSPSFMRITFTSPGLDRFRDNGSDQRIKLVFPLPGHGFATLPTGPDWYRQWRSLPETTRNPIRTYTARAVRPQSHEIDVDFAVHGDSGPGSRWARRAHPGDTLAILGPDACYDGDHGGVEFHPPQHLGSLLIAGDETAVPAIGAILERIPSNMHGEVLLEVAHRTDVMPLQAPPGMTVSWLARDAAPHGTRLVPAVSAAADRLLFTRPTTPATPLHDVDVDTGILWEVPAINNAAPLYAWLAGEAGVIRTLRRLLVSEHGMDRHTMAFMGYWRLGRPDEE